MIPLLRPIGIHRCLNKLTGGHVSLLTNSFSSQQQAQVKETGIQQEKLTLDYPNDDFLRIDPLDVPDYFGVHQCVSLRQLFNCRAHYGHKEGTLNQYMTPYVYGSRLGICIIDLNQTVIRLKEALNVAAHIAFRDGIILFVSNHRETGQYVEKTAMECGEYAHCRPFSPRTLTASRGFFGKVMRLPDLVIFLTTFNNVFLDHEGVKDAARMLIPTIAIVDTNSDPRLVTYPIPGNDDTPSAIHLYCDLFKQAILKGKAKRKELLRLGQELDEREGKTLTEKS